MDQAFAVKHDQSSVSVLASRFGCDLVAATVSSFSVSPFITILDRAMAENASGKRSLMHGVKELSAWCIKHPIQFCKNQGFRWIFGLYTATYATANTLNSYFEWKEEDGQMVTLGATTLVNMSSVIAKDSAFARMYGVVKPRPFPLASIGLFAIRDSLTVVSCFHAPKVISEKLRDLGVGESTTTAIAQIGAPIAVQILSTPLHLLGLDLYNHPVADRQARLQFIQREYFSSTVARVARVGPAFGIVGIANASMRTSLRAMTERDI
ncbi:hypothetical protein PINS_up007840 [Pythium insidiosum]|nr:hypothetical protein PINS_up007840 [Pythium insidiosum]